MLSSRMSSSHSSLHQSLAMNENHHLRTTATDPSLVSKTPATSRNKNRRALGDISNRKITTNVSKEPPAKSGGVAVSCGTASIVARNKVQQNGALVAFKTKQTSISASKPAAGVASKNKAEFKSVTFEFDEYGDVELPAGRLWVDQQKNDDDSCNSGDVSLEGVKTAREDLLQALEERYQRKLQLAVEEDERCLQVLDSQVEHFFKHQEDKSSLNPPPFEDSFTAEELVLDMSFIEDDYSFSRPELSL